MRVLSERWQRVTVAAGSLAWLALSALVWAIGVRVGLGWHLLVQCVSMLASAAGGLAIGIWFLDPAKARLDHRRAVEERTSWLHLTFPLVLLNQDSLRHACASVADELYGLACASGVVENPIPRATLRADISRRPVLSVDLGQGAEFGANLATLLKGLVDRLASGLAEQEREHRTGPLAIACMQVAEARSVFNALEVNRGQRYVARVLGETPRPDLPVLTGYRTLPADALGRLGDPEAERVAEAIGAGTLDGVVARADWVLRLASEVVGPREVDPSPVRHAALALNLRAHRAADCAADSGFSETVGTLGDTPRAESDVRRAAVLLGVIEEGLSAVAGVRHAVDALTLATLRLGLDLDAPRAAAHYLSTELHRQAGVRLEFEGVSLPQDDWLGGAFSWDLWRRRHGLLLDGETVGDAVGGVTK